MQQKKEEMRIQIRRKKLNERMSAIRNALLIEGGEKSYQIPSEILKIDCKDKVEVSKHLDRLKIMSGSQSSAKQLRRFFEVLLELLVNQTQDSQFGIISTILINLTSLSSPLPSLQMEAQRFNQILLQLVKMILIPSREISTLWLLGNIIYHREEFSFYTLQELLKYDLIPFIIGRMKRNFNETNQLIIFNYFCSSLLSCAQELTFKDYKIVLNLLQEMQSFANEEIDWYILLALIDHLPFAAKHKYEILGRKLLQNYSKYCQRKKSKQVIKFLEAMQAFLKSERLTSLEGISTARHLERYQRIESLELLKNMGYCLENRHPVVKRLCFQIGTLLLKSYSECVDIEREDYYVLLGAQFATIDKYFNNAEVVAAAIEYIKVLIGCVISRSSETKEREYEIAKFLNESCLVEKISATIEHFREELHIEEIVDPCIQIMILLLQKMNVETIQASLNRNHLSDLLEHMPNNQKVEHLLELLRK